MTLTGMLYQMNFKIRNEIVEYNCFVSVFALSFFMLLIALILRIILSQKKLISFQIDSTRRLDAEKS